MVYDSNNLQKLVRIASLPTAQTQSKRRKKREREEGEEEGKREKKREIKIIKQSKSDAHLMLLSLPVISH